MKTENETVEMYVTPEAQCHILICEGALCLSGGTNEGVDFEDWN